MVDQMLQQGIVEASCSPWSRPVIGEVNPNVHHSETSEQRTPEERPSSLQWPNWMERNHFLIVILGPSGSVI